MTRVHAYLISVVFFFLANPLTKKEQILALCKKYFPENYIVLKEYDEALINGLAQGESLKDFIADVSTIVHEGYHHYTGNHTSYYDASVVFRINDSLSFSVKTFATFPAREINNIVPAVTRKKIFRYDSYINSKDKYLVTQQFGILGLLEECIAYYHSFSTDVSLFNYYQDTYGWKDPDTWITYLSNMASYRYAIPEFELFISWYLQYAKTNHPKTYSDIANNRELKKLFVFLDREQSRLTSLYDQHRSFILRQFGDKLQIRGNYLHNTASHSGKGLYDEEVNEMAAELQKPEHRILEVLKK